MRPFPKVVPAVIVVLLLGLQLGCLRSSGQPDIADEYTIVAPDQKLTVDAYYMDARVWRDNKPTSVRLQLFHTDSLMGMAGTGYLGKGALQGWITEDTVFCYFPSSNEYFRQSLDDFFATKACTSMVPAPSLFRMLAGLPDSASLGRVTMTSDLSHADRRGYAIAWIDCPWRMDLVYDLRSEVWRLSEFRFKTGDDFRVTARRRVLKADTEVDWRKIKPRAKSGAVRITP